MPNARIIGTGRAIPDVLVTNEELSRRMDTSDEWIQQRTGIRPTPSPVAVWLVRASASSPTGGR